MSLKYNEGWFHPCMPLLLARLDPDFGRRAPPSRRIAKGCGPKRRKPKKKAAKKRSKTRKLANAD
jgi:hypothetical protein